MASAKQLVRHVSNAVVTITELLWALIGLLLTIGGNFFKAAIIALPLSAHFLGVSYQIGAVLLVGCLGGRNAAIISQIAYLLLGLAGFPIFTKGGGLQYFTEPSFGYLLGFIPGAWLCGYLAFRAAPRLEWLAASCLAGLAAIHTVGATYLGLSYGLRWSAESAMALQQALLLYSGKLLVGQLAVVCAVTVLAFGLRRLMFY
jgi:biotin transport system substrate-specific component